MKAPLTRQNVEEKSPDEILKLMEKYPHNMTFVLDECGEIIDDKEELFAMIMKKGVTICNIGIIPNFTLDPKETYLDAWYAIERQKDGHQFMQDKMISFQNGEIDEKGNPIPKGEVPS